METVTRLSRIDVIPVGNLGNRMLQLMLLESLKRLAPQVRLGGISLPEWGITSARLLSEDRPALRLIGQHVDVPWLASLIRAGLIDKLEFAALGFRMAHYLPRHEYQHLFPRRPCPEVPGLQSSLLINVRGAEILKDTHADYGPLPIDFYRQVIERTGLPPIFMGQLADDPYSAALRHAFPNARFTPSQGAEADFEIIRSARHIVASVSTFSWLAAWLSDANSIHLPLCGIFNPRQRPDIDLTALGDSRYRCYEFPVRHWVGSDAQFQALSQPARCAEIGAVEVDRLVSEAASKLRARLLRYRINLAVRAGLFKSLGLKARIKLAVD